MVHRTLIVVAALLGALTPGLARAGESLAELVSRVEQLRINKAYAEAAKLATEGAEREDLANYERVVLGGLAQQNYELSRQAGGPLTDLCELARVMRLVAQLDSEEGRGSKIRAAEEAEAQLGREAGPGWRSVCAPETATEPAVGDSAGMRGEATPPIVATVAEPPREDVKSEAVKLVPRADHVIRRRVRAGVGTLTSGLLMAAPVVGLLVYRGRVEGVLKELRVDTQGSPRSEEALNQAVALNRRYEGVTAGVAVLGGIGAALVVTGVTLLATSGRQARVAISPWGAREFGGAILMGRF